MLKLLYALALGCCFLMLGGGASTAFTVLVSLISSCVAPAEGWSVKTGLPSASLD